MRHSEISENLTREQSKNIVRALRDNMCVMYASYRNALSFMDSETQTAMSRAYRSIFENMFCPKAFNAMFLSLEKLYPDKEPTLPQLKKVYLDCFAKIHTDILNQLQQIDDRIDFLNGELMIEPNEFAPPEPNREQVIHDKILQLRQRRSSMLESYTKEK